MADQFQGFESIASFNEEFVQQKLRETMVFGMASDDANKPTFYFDPDRTWSDDDTEGNPWDWDTVPDADTTKSPVQVICATEFFSPLGRQGASFTEVGEFNPNTVVITLFQDEFDAVYGFSYVTVGPEQRKYFFRFWKPAISLGNIPVYQVHAVSEGQ